jgi:hypothetical protein
VESTLFIGLCFLIFAMASTSHAQTHQHVEVITTNDAVYEIEVGGFRDPVNETIIIENLGETPLVNPRITVNDQYDWFDEETMAQEATRGCETDEEKALALYEFVRANFHHLGNAGDREVHNPVVALNIYGYSNCAYHATNFVSLCRAIGIPARVWEVWHHTVSEAYYNDAWHMLDSDIGLYYLTGDNRTIASVEQLWEDQKVSEGLEEKAHVTTFSGRNKALRQIYTDVEGGNAQISQDGEMIRGYRYFHGSDFCYIQEDYDRFTFEPHNMAMTLRPGEMLKRNWIGRDIFFDYKRKKASFEGGNSYAIPIRYGDGQLIWRPDLTSKLAPTFINKNQAPVFMTHDGQHPPLHVRNKQGGLYDFEERVIIQTETPYTILGGKVKARLYRGAATDWDRLSLTIGSTTGPIKKRIWEAPEGVIGSIDAEVNLDEVLYPTGERGRHDHTLEFNFAANEKNDPPTQSGIESIEIVTDIQVAPNSLPALSRGKNVIRFRPQWKVMYKKG